MKIVLLLSFSFFIASCEAMQDFTGTDLYRCIECLCHARTGCYSRINCASYSISFDYWKKARSPVLDVDDDPDSQQSYRKCMKNEMCIINTINQYIEEIGQFDCNCDGVFDCKDRLAIHLFGENCVNPNFGSIMASRFNRCARMRNLGVSLMQNSEGSSNCIVEAV